MESGGSRLVVTELSHIKDLVMQLETHLDGSHDRCRNLVSQISSLTERSIGMVTSTAGFKFNSGRKWRGGENATGLASATPNALSDVPLKKRKTTIRKVKVKQAEGGREPVDDGHSWRKYGHKPIQGACYPRSYYRCRHRNTQGCRAMKKVQRADEDPTLFDVIYYFAHTCVDRTSEEAAGAGQLIAPALDQEHDHHHDSHSCLVHDLSGSLTVVKTEAEGLAAAAAAATEPRGWNDGSTTPFDEFLDIDVISSFFD